VSKETTTSFSHSDHCSAIDKRFGLVLLVPVSCSRHIMGLVSLNCCPGLWIHETAGKVFNTCRIPQPHCDSLSHQPPPNVPNARKILVMVNDWIYAVEVYDKNRKLYSVDDIEQRLRSVVQDATRRKQAGEKAVPVGILSSDHRDRWTEVRFFHVLGPCVSSLHAEPRISPLTLHQKPSDPQGHPTVDPRRQP
jgi:hypothetical protein